MSGKHPVDQIEPSALVDSGLLFPMEKSVVDSYRLQLSIAISLKRIADALHGDDQNTGMKHALAEMANRAFNGWGPTS